MIRPAQAYSLRGMDLPEEFRVGPVFHGGIPLGGAQPGDRQYYLLELRGESPNHGFSRIFLRALTLYELLKLPNLSLQNDSNPRQVRMHHQFFGLGFESPIYYAWSQALDFELGWTGGFTLAKVLFKEPQKVAGQDTGLISLFSDYPEIQPSQIAQPKNNPAQQDAQFIGGQLGLYGRYYGFFPVVPYLSLGLNLGSFLDKSALVEGVEQSASGTAATPVLQPAKPLPRQRLFQSAFRTGPVLGLGLDCYLFSRGLLGMEYMLWNWDFAQTSDYTHVLTLKAGFLF